MSVIGDVASFVRWRFLPLRYAGKLRGVSASRVFARTLPPKTESAKRICEDGYVSALKLSLEQLAQITQMYGPRSASVLRRERGHPFENLFQAQDIDPRNPVFRLAFAPEILDVADDYFAGRFILDSIQVLYSWPTHGEVHDSQMWHKDYGDTKSFHWICYLNDVRGPDDGPFSFIDKRDTRRIASSIFIRRIADEKFSRELGDGRLRSFIGAAGDSVFVDPSACYHYGSRCKNPRLAIFVTFNTDNPFVAPTPLVRENARRIYDAARQVRPDLGDLYLKRLLQMP